MDLAWITPSSRGLCAHRFGVRNWGLPPVSQPNRGQTLLDWVLGLSEQVGDGGKDNAQCFLGLQIYCGFPKSVRHSCYVSQVKDSGRTCYKNVVGSSPTRPNPCAATVFAVPCDAASRMRFFEGLECDFSRVPFAAIRGRFGARTGTHGHQRARAGVGKTHNPVVVGSSPPAPRLESYCSASTFGSPVT